MLVSVSGVRRPSPTSEENESINTDFFITRDADIVDKVSFISQSTQSCHEPTITVSALAYI